jgi:hypothetical protein
MAALTKDVAEELHGRKVVLMDSIAMLEEEDAGHVVVSGSHGGVSAASYATAVPVRGVFFNDAGVGKDGAGVTALRLLDAVGIPAGAVDHDSARIGDARDHWESGVLSHINDAAREKGLREGEPLRSAARRLLET